jgi:hypothetical protein
MDAIDGLQGLFNERTLYLEEVERREFDWTAPGHRAVPRLFSRQFFSQPLRLRNPPGPPR